MQADKSINADVLAPGFARPMAAISDVEHHMYPCPNCSRKSFRFTAKLWSCAALPAKCRECGSLCFAPTSPGGVLLVFNTVFLAVSGLLAAHWHSAVPLAIGGTAAVILWMLRLHVQPLIALTADQAAAARKREGFWLFVFFLLIALQ